MVAAPGSWTGLGGAEPDALAVNTVAAPSRATAISFPSLAMVSAPGWGGRTAEKCSLGGWPEMGEVETAPSPTYATEEPRGVDTRKALPPGVGGTWSLPRPCVPSEPADSLSHSPV